MNSRQFRRCHLDHGEDGRLNAANQEGCDHADITKEPVEAACRPGEDLQRAPVALPGRCIAISTDPGDVVLDPFIGSGNTAVAALTLGRRLVGVDVSRQYLDLAEAKIRELETRLPIDISVSAQPKESKSPQRSLADYVTAGRRRLGGSSPGSSNGAQHRPQMIGPSSICLGVSWMRRGSGRHAHSTGVRRPPRLAGRVAWPRRAATTWSGTPALVRFDRGNARPPSG